MCSTSAATKNNIKSTMLYNIKIDNVCLNRAFLRTSTQYINDIITNMIFFLLRQIIQCVCACAVHIVSQLYWRKDNKLKKIYNILHKSKGVHKQILYMCGNFFCQLKTVVKCVDRVFLFGFNTCIHIAYLYGIFSLFSSCLRKLFSFRFF